jgi:hypothetical protein
VGQGWACFLDPGCLGRECCGHHHYPYRNSGHDRDPVLDPGRHCQGARRGRERRSRGVVGVERLRGRDGRIRVECEFLQDQVIPDLVEDLERRVACNDGSKMIVPLVQPLKNIEDEVTVGYGTSKVAQGVGHTLHLATVVTHREVTLDEVMEHGVNMKRVRFIVADELILDCAPNLTRDDVVLLGNVLKFTGYHDEDLGADDTLHALPSRVIDRRGIGEDVVGEVIALQGEQNLIALAGVACRRRIHNSQNKRVTIMYPTDIHV